MEDLTRLVTESLARHGFDRPLDYRRLQWSRWFRCDSPHSLLCVPSKPGVFAIAEEIMDVGPTTHVGAAALAAPPSKARLVACWPSLNSWKRMTWHSSSTACSRAQIPCVRISNPDAISSASSPSQTNPSAAASPAPSINGCSSSSEKATDIGSHFASSLELTPATEYVPQPNDAQGTLFAPASKARVATDAFVRPASEASGPPPFPSGF